MNNRYSDLFNILEGFEIKGVPILPLLLRDKISQYTLHLPYSTKYISRMTLGSSRICKLFIDNNNNFIHIFGLMVIGFSPKLT